MPLVAVVTCLALLQFVIFAMLVGWARGKYGVAAPATTGHPVFERYYRVQMNTLEQLVVFLPSLWIFGYYIGETWAAGFGAVFIVGRVLYLLGYVADPKKREIGFGMSFFPVLALLIGALYGAGRAVL
jgi:glutathione S-transferase